MKTGKFYLLSPYAQVLSRIEDGMIFVVNDAFLNLFGLQSENVIG